VIEGRRYSVGEADALLEELRARLPLVREARQGLIDSSARITEAVAGDGGGVAGSDWFQHQQTLKEQLEWLAEHDILLRDPESGLVDFPSERDGRPVFLCWRVGEAAVSYFHPEATGYSGRQPL
jgi:hypothetical protein